MEKIRKKTQRHLSALIMNIVLGIVLALYALSLFWTLGWAIITSLKDNMDFLRNIIGLPKGTIADWQWDNYITAFNSFFVTILTKSGLRTVYLLEMFMNSVLYSLGCAVMSTSCACVMAYLSARFKYKASKVIYVVVIVAMIVPIVGSLPSEIQMVSSLGLYDTFWGVWILKSNFLGMYFLVFFAIFKGVPTDYSEAAKIDGAGNLTLFIRIMLPLVLNTYLTVLLLNFIVFWNDYQIPLIYIPSYPTVSYGLYLFNFASSGVTNSTPMKIAGSFLVMLPILIVFLIFHNRLIGNINMGGLKE